MSTWIKDNKSIVAVIGVGAVAFLGLTSYGVMQLLDKDDIYTEFQASKAKVQSAASRPNTPTQNIVLEKEEQSKEYVSLLGNIESLYDKFRPSASELTLTTPESFRTKLNSTSDDFKKFATANDVKFKSDFRMGFDRYATIPALQQATGVLQYELDAIDWLLKKAVESNVSEVTRVYRESLPIETAEPPPSANAKPTTATSRTAPVAAKAQEEFQRLPFSVTLRGKRQSIVKLINEITNSEKYLFTVQGLRAINEKSVAQTIAPSAPAAAPAPTKPQGGALDLGAGFGQPTAKKAEPSAPAEEEILLPVAGLEQADFHLVLNLILFPAKDEGSTEATPAAEAKQK